MSFAGAPVSSDPQREAFALAHILAGQLAVSGPTLPTDVSVRPGEIRLYFHHNAAAVQAFGAVHGLTVRFEARSGGAQIYVSAAGTVQGVEVEAWALEIADELATALTPAGLLAEQRHQLLDDAVPSEGAAHPLTVTA